MGGTEKILEEIRTIHYPNFMKSTIPLLQGISTNLKLKKCEENYTMTNCLKPVSRKSSSYIQKNICHKDDNRLFINNNTSQKYFKVLKEKNFDPISLPSENIFQK